MDGSSMVIFGGQIGSSNYARDVWAIDFTGYIAGWTQLIDPASYSHAQPASRASHAAVLFSENTMLIFAGKDETGLILDDVWALGTQTHPSPQLHRQRHTQPRAQPHAHAGSP